VTQENPRSSAQFVAAFRNNPRAAVHQGFDLGAIVDLSETGAKILLNEGSAMRLGDVVEILWSPLSGLKPFVIQAKCVWQRQGQAGVTFVELEARARYVLRSLVKFHLG